MPEQTGPTQRAWRRWLGRYGLVAALLLVALSLHIATPAFLKAGNLVLVVRQISINGILAVGVTFVLLTGGVDLSLGSVVALTGVVAALVAQCQGPPVAVAAAAVAAGILAGAACGALNGLAVTAARVPPFVATLGMMTAARGMALVLSRGRPVKNLSPAFTAIAAGDWLGVPVLIWLLAVVAGASYVFLRHIRLGRYVYAVGGNEAAARASGIRVGGVKLMAYTICGALAGLAGVILASRLTVGQPNEGVAYELDAIAAAVIGGTSLSGGLGGVRGTVLGALLMGTINNGLDLLNVSSYYQKIVKGGIIIGAVWLDRRARR